MPILIYFSGIVHPTGVGMIRMPTVVVMQLRSSSHGCGNDSIGILGNRLIIPVHPTGVGMIRRLKKRKKM